jgi:iron complex outermembrane recepter protein
MQFKYTFLYLLAAVCTVNFAEAQIDSDEDKIIDLQQVNITASPFALKQEDLVISSHSLNNRQLARSTQSSLGATLEGEAGISMSAFSQGASRPIIRGHGGDRVRILQNGTDAFDVSFTSPDHGVAVEPLLTDRIEIIRGPASLLYGNAAIGGVVNVIDKSMPHQPVEGIDGAVEFRHGTVANERVGGVSAQGGDRQVAWSIGYVKRDADDYDIPGFAESEYLRQQEALAETGHEESEEHTEEEEVFGTLENSFLQSESLSLGLGWFSENAVYGFAFNQYESFYGVPGHGHEHKDGEDGDKQGEEQEAESVVIDLKKHHFSFRAEWMNPLDFFESVELDIGYGDYEHTELEGSDGEREVGTRFKRDGFDLRFVGIHKPLDNLTGAWGVQIKDESFKAVGEEAFIPSNDLTSAAVFAIERFQTNWGAVEFGSRLETQSLKPSERNLGNSDQTTYNLSVGTVTNLENDSIIASNIAYNQRAPNAAELFAFGPHAGTQSFEIGKADLDIEASLNAEVSWRKSIGFITGEFTLYYSDFKNFIFLSHLEEEDFETLFPDKDSDGLDILIAESVAAEFYGYELDLSFHLIDSLNQHLHFDLVIDQTYATNQTDNTNLPRIPTRRVGARLEYETGPWSIGGGIQFHSKAGHLAPEETPTESYTLAEANITYTIEAGTTVIDLFAIGRNLTNEEARPHTSFVKDLVPLPGRNVELGVKVFF